MVTCFTLPDRQRQMICHPASWTVGPNIWKSRNETASCQHLWHLSTIRFNLCYHSASHFIARWNTVSSLTGQDSHSTMDCIRTTTCQCLHQDIEQFWPGFRPVPVRNGRHSVRYTDAYTSNWFSKSDRQQASNINFRLQNNSPTSHSGNSNNIKIIIIINTQHYVYDVVIVTRVHPVHLITI